jgi:hypothetical protein
MNDTLEESDRGIIEVFSRHLLGETAENHKKISVRIACVPAEIRTEHIPNRNLERRRYANPFGAVCKLLPDYTT